jgi:hypothetical protein
VYRNTRPTNRPMRGQPGTSHPARPHPRASASTAKALLWRVGGFRTNEWGEALVERLIANLLDNAVRYKAPGGRAGHCCILGSWVGSAYMGGQPRSMASGRSS